MLHHGSQTAYNTGSQPFVDLCYGNRCTWARPPLPPENGTRQREGEGRADLTVISKLAAERTLACGFLLPESQKPNGL